MRNKEVNQGYEIKEHFVVGDIGIALCESISAPSPYVAWDYLKEKMR